MAHPNKKLYSSKGLTPEQQEIRNVCMRSLKGFVALVAPLRMLGHCHKDLLDQLQDEDILNQLILWPRGHQKSTMLAYYAAWRVINKPEITIMYVSATAALAEAQLTFIKTILDCEAVRLYWPELLSPDEGRRERWRADEIMVDHWKRKEEAIRDPTVKTVGMGANITGFHCDELLLDDLVVMDNAETKTERDKVKRYFSLLTSILNPGGVTKAVGTRYHPDDLYNDMMEMQMSIFDDKGNVVDEEPMFKFSAEVVEVDGEYLWPRAKRKDGQWFGFNNQELARIKAKYLDKAQFFAQYYNDPSDPQNKRVSNFNYYDKSLLRRSGESWYFGEKKLNIFAAIDFAATITKKADYTAIVVVGVDCDKIMYVLDISRFRTDKISVMAEELTKLYDKWRWLKLKAETNAQQNLVVEQIKEFNRNQGTYYTIEKKPSQGDKNIRIMAALEPRYSAGHILHYRGGNCEVLEQELIATKPPHDDVSDALASCCEIIIAPSKKRQGQSKVTQLKVHPRYGGIV